MSRPIRRIAVAAAVLLAGCTLADVTVPAGEDRLVVQAVLRTDRTMHSVLLHRGVVDGVAAGVPDAEVVVTGPGGTAHRFALAGGPVCYDVDPAYPADDPRIEASCYTAAFPVLPGAAYELTVTTPRGETARGRTVVPGAFALVTLPFATEPASTPVCRIPPATPVPVAWTRAPGAWGYLAPLNIAGLSRVLPDSIDAPDPLELVGVAVSAADTTIVLPTEFGVFDRFDFDQDLLRVLQAGLPPGVEAGLVVAAADRNYINGVRGGSFNPSGPVRVSSVVGDGVGVFGSLVPLHTSVVATTDPAYPPCGA